MNIDELAAREAELWARLAAARAVMRDVHAEWTEALTALGDAISEEAQ